MDTVIERIANKLIDVLVSESHIQTSKKDVYVYGAIVAIQSSINFIFTLIIGIVFKMSFEMICFYLCFKILRKFSGGFHSSKYVACLSISIIINIVVVVLLKHMIVYVNPIVFFALEIVSLLVIILFSPIQNISKNISVTEKRIYKIISSTISIILCPISMFLIINNNIFGYVMGLSLLLNSALILFELIKVHF